MALIDKNLLRPDILNFLLIASRVRAFSFFFCDPSKASYPDVAPVGGGGGYKKKQKFHFCKAKVDSLVNKAVYPSENTFFYFLHSKI